MKKLVFFLLSLCYFSNIYAQPVSLAQQVSILDSKATKQKRTGWILLGAGAGTALIGSALGVANVYDELLLIDEKTPMDAAGVLAITGLVSMAGSIPFFIAAGKNRKKAAALVYIKMENRYYVNQYTTNDRNYPAITLSVSF